MSRSSHVTWLTWNCEEVLLRTSATLETNSYALIWQMYFALGGKFSLKNRSQLRISLIRLENGGKFFKLRLSLTLGYSNKTPRSKLVLNSVTENNIHIKNHQITIKPWICCVNFFCQNGKALVVLQHSHKSIELPEALTKSLKMQCLLW